MNFDKIDYKAKQIQTRPDNSNMQGVHWEITLNDCKPFYYSEGIRLFLNCDELPRFKEQDEVNALMIKYLSNSLTNPELSKVLDLFRRYNVKVRHLRCGEYHPRYFNFTITPPELEDVLYSLTMDSDAVDYRFSDWCANMGYDDDSMKAKALYDGCIENSHILRDLRLDLKELQAHFEDY